MAKTYLCCITQVWKLLWHHGLRDPKCISTTIDNFSLSMQCYSSVVPSNLILCIQFLQSHCYNTLHKHPNSSNIRRSIDRHSLPHHNRWKSTTKSTLKPLALRVPFVLRLSIHPLHRHLSIQAPTSTVPGDSRETGRSPLVYLTLDDRAHGA